MLLVGDVMDLAARLKSSGRGAEPLPLEFLQVVNDFGVRPMFEARRLSAVHQSKLIDTPAEETFHRITALASHVCDCPMTLVTLLTSTRQRFKSRGGVGLAETPRDDAFCSYAVLERAPFIVENTATDPRFAATPLVLGEPYIGFYAGFPVYGVDELPLGTLAVLDREPRKLTRREMESMVQLAEVVSEELLRRSNMAV
jgi:GAF domain-containing protein